MSSPEKAISLKSVKAKVQVKGLPDSISRTVGLVTTQQYAPKESRMIDVLAALAIVHRHYMLKKRALEWEDTAPRGTLT